MSLEEEREEDGFSPKAQTGEWDKAEHANAENRTRNPEICVHVAVNGGGEHLDSAEGSVTEVEEVQEEEEDVGTGPPSPVTAAASVLVRWVVLTLAEPCCSTALPV